MHSVGGGTTPFFDDGAAPSFTVGTPCRTPLRLGDATLGDSTNAATPVWATHPVGDDSRFGCFSGTAGKARASLAQLPPATPQRQQPSVAVSARPSTFGVALKGRNSAANNNGASLVRSTPTQAPPTTPTTHETSGGPSVLPLQRPHRRPLAAGGPLPTTSRRDTNDEDASSDSPQEIETAFPELPASSSEGYGAFADTCAPVHVADEERALDFASVMRALQATQREAAHAAFAASMRAGPREEVFWAEAGLEGALDLPWSD